MEKALPHQRELKLLLTPMTFFAITREEFLIANDAKNRELALAEWMVKWNNTCPDMYKKPGPDDLNRKIAWLRLRNRRGIWRFFIHFLSKNSSWKPRDRCVAMNECNSAGHLWNLSLGNAFRKGAVSTHSQLHSAILPAAQSRCLSFLSITLFP